MMLQEKSDYQFQTHAAAQNPGSAQAGHAGHVICKQVAWHVLIFRTNKLQLNGTANIKQYGKHMQFMFYIPLVSSGIQAKKLICSVPASLQQLSSLVIIY